MEYRAVPHFIIKDPMNKTSKTGRIFSDEVTEAVLRDVCRRITGFPHFTVDHVDKDYEDEFVPKSYNKGRTAVLLFQDTVCYISFSQPEIEGRNSSVQSVPTAFNLFYNSAASRKKLYYYFLDLTGNAATNYQLLVYRMMATVGFVFLNDVQALGRPVQAFTSIEDIILHRRSNAGKNKSNNSTFLTRGPSGGIEVYGKTYGANKYETALFCYALSRLCPSGEEISLYEVLDGDMKQMPAPVRTVLDQMGTVKVIPTDMSLEKKLYRQDGGLRSPRYLYNLFQKLGRKRCALCGCEIPELVQGAHIWPVAQIKRAPAMPLDRQLACALDGDNGLWLCENHHKLFDKGLFTFKESGQLQYRPGLEAGHLAWIQESVTTDALPRSILTPGFLDYLRRRNGTN